MRQLSCGVGVATSTWASWALVLREVPEHGVTWSTCLGDKSLHQQMIKNLWCMEANQQHWSWILSLLSSWLTASDKIGNGKSFCLVGLIDTTIQTSEIFCRHAVGICLVFEHKNLSCFVIADRCNKMRHWQICIQFFFHCHRSISASCLILTCLSCRVLIRDRDVHFSIFIFLIRVGSSSSFFSSLPGHLTMRCFMGSIALCSCFFVNWVAFFTKAAISFFELFVSSLALFFQDSMLLSHNFSCSRNCCPLTSWLAPWESCTQRLSWVLLSPCNTQHCQSVVPLDSLPFFAPFEVLPPFAFCAGKKPIGSDFWTLSSHFWFQMHWSTALFWLWAMMCNWHAMTVGELWLSNWLKSTASSKFFMHDQAAPQLNSGEPLVTTVFKHVDSKSDNWSTGGCHNSMQSRCWMAVDCFVTHALINEFKKVIGRRKLDCRLFVWKNCASLRNPVIKGKWREWQPWLSFCRCQTLPRIQFAPQNQLHVEECAKEDQILVDPGPSASASEFHTKGHPQAHLLLATGHCWKVAANKESLLCWCASCACGGSWCSCQRALCHKWRLARCNTFLAGS